jgi:hypothetical protein
MGTGCGARIVLEAGDLCQGFPSHNGFRSLFLRLNAGSWFNEQPAKFSMVSVR